MGHHPFHEGHYRGDPIVIGPRFSEGVEYLFNYAPEELAMWTRDTFFGSPARGLGTTSLLLFGALGVMIFLVERRERNGS